jgi:hypothetical protein
LIFWGFFGLSIMAFYQIRFGILVWPRIIAILILFLHLSTILFGAFKLYKLSQDQIDSIEMKIKYGSYFEELQYSMRIFSITCLFVKLINAFAVSFFTNDPILQFFTLVVAESFYLVLLLLLRPFQDKIRSKLMIFISFIRLLSVSLTGLFIPEWLKISDSSTEAISYIFILCHTIVIFTLLISALRSLIYTLKSKSRKSKSSSADHLSVVASDGGSSESQQSARTFADQIRGNRTLGYH